jgi:hypothetical protein
MCCGFTGFADPYSFDTDPDPTVKAECRTGSGSRVLMTKNLKREHPALQTFEFLNFFLLSSVIFALLDSDPDLLI